MVKLTKIYTRTGDDGTTGLSDFTRVRKTDTRIEAYADVDEANSVIGLALSLSSEGFDAETRALLVLIQNELFDVGADLATPLRDSYDYEPIRVEQSMVDALEQGIDKYNAQLDKLDAFILPGGSQLSATMHLARTVVRRAERATWHAIDTVGNINPLTAKYLNRLSDLLFVLARIANLNHGGDVKWLPHTKR